MTVSAPTGIGNTITATISSDIVYNTTQTDSGNLVLTESDKTNFSFAYAFGTGTGQINFITKVEGTLSSGGTDILDLQAIPKSSFNSTYNVSLAQLKCIQVHNEALNSGFDINLRATGTNSFTNLFNGGSGNEPIKPMSAFPKSDPFDGWSVSASNRLLSIHDVGGSGASYQIILGGILS